MSRAAACGCGPIIWLISAMPGPRANEPKKALQFTASRQPAVGYPGTTEQLNPSGLIKNWKRLLFGDSCSRYRALETTSMLNNLQICTRIYTRVTVDGAPHCTSQKMAMLIGLQWISAIYFDQGVIEQNCPPVFLKQIMKTTDQVPDMTKFSGFQVSEMLRVPRLRWGSEPPAPRR